MRNIAIFFIKIYRNYLSLLKLQQSCIYYPSCSEYAISALGKHGFLRGSFISILRILRCHPFSHGGYDPVIAKSRPKFTVWDRFHRDRGNLSQQMRG